MASDLTPNDIRDVKFREKLRGYHPEDVDKFIVEVAATVEALQRRLDTTATSSTEPNADDDDDQAIDLDERSGSVGEIEESLRRTLVLAQRTADLAVQEAQEEASRLLREAEDQRSATIDEVTSLRERSMRELEQELSGERARLHADRAALQRDVAALDRYVAQERERLRIYFTQQLAQVDAGVPGVEPPPALEAAEQEPAPSDAALAEQDIDDRAVGSVEDHEDDGDDASGDPDHDPYLAELRRAVNDNEPLGPRDHDPAAAAGDDRAVGSDRDERDLEIFTNDDSGRFLRRRR